jgi:hypothetical protein
MGGQHPVAPSTQATTGSIVRPVLSTALQKRSVLSVRARNLFDCGPDNICSLLHSRAEDFRSWALTKYAVRRFLLFFTFTTYVYSVIREAHLCRCRLRAQWSVNNLVTSLHCFLFKASRSLDSVSEGSSIPAFGVLHSQPLNLSETEFLLSDV